MLIFTVLVIGTISQYKYRLAIAHAKLIFIQRMLRRALLMNGFLTTFITVYIDYSYT